MAYADYEYYATEFYGTAIDEDAFLALAGRASAYVDYVTMNRARNVTNDAMIAVKNAVCALAEVMQDGERLNSVAFNAERLVASESVGDWSKSYGTKAVSSADMQLLEARKREIAAMYLAPYGLLKARGFGSCPCSHTR